MDIRQYLSALDAILSAFQSLTRAIVVSGYSPDDKAESTSRLTESLVEAVRNSRGQVYEKAAAYLVDEARRQGVTGDVYVPGQSGYPAGSIETILREELRGSPEEAAARISARLSQHVLSAGRQTIVRSVEDGVAGESAADREHLEHTRLTPREKTRAEKDLEQRARIFERLREARLAESGGVDIYQWQRDRALADRKNKVAGASPIASTGKQPQAWARVLTGAENCGFCVMLASRGAVYETAENAGRGKASNVHPDANDTQWINTYHPRCDCLVVPVYDYSKWPGKEAHEELEAFYIRTIREATWEDEEGEEQEGITYKHGPSKRNPRNQVVAALDRALEEMASRGEALDIPDLR